MSEEPSDLGDDQNEKARPLELLAFTSTDWLSGFTALMVVVVGCAMTVMSDSGSRGWTAVVSVALAAVAFVYVHVWARVIDLVRRDYAHAVRAIAAVDRRLLEIPDSGSQVSGSSIANCMKIALLQIGCDRRAEDIVELRKYVARLVGRSPLAMTGVIVAKEQLFADDPSLPARFYSIAYVNPDVWFRGSTFPLLLALQGHSMMRAIRNTKKGAMPGFEVDRVLVWNEHEAIEHPGLDIIRMCRLLNVRVHLFPRERLSSLRARVSEGVANWLGTEFWLCELNGGGLRGVYGEERGEGEAEECRVIDQTRDAETCRALNEVYRVIVGYSEEIAPGLFNGGAMVHNLFDDTWLASQARTALARAADACGNAGVAKDA